MLNRLWIAPLLALAAHAAATTYTFTGQPYTTTANHSTCALGTCVNYTGSDKVTGTLAVSGVLPANLNNQNISGTVQSWSFDDGHGAIQSSDARSFFGFSGITVTTNCSGQITNWFVDVFQWATNTPAGDLGGPKTLDARYRHIFSGGVLDMLDNSTDFVQNNYECLTINGGQCALVPQPQTTDSSYALTGTVGNWSGGGYSVSYDGNGSTGGSVQAACSAHAAGDNVAVAANTGNLVRSGYVFAGWNTSPSGNGTHYAGDGTAALTMPAANLTLYAQWTSTSTCIAPATGIVSWWPGDGSAHDKYGGNDATLQGSATYGAGEVLQAFSMAANGYVEAPYGANLSTPQLTVAAWVNPASQQGPASIVNRRPAGNAAGWTLEQRFDKSGLVLWNLIAGGTSISVVSNAVLPLNAWTHVAATYDGATSRLYFNGTEVGNTPATGAADAVAAGTVLQIGRNIVTGAQFDGLIDEVAVYDRALTPAQLAAIADAGSLGQCKSLIDVDANGQTDALTDGLMILRYLFGLSGASITTTAVGANAARSTPAAIAAYLDQIKPALDVDGNGQSDALTDGLLILRYLFGLRDAALIQNAVAAGAPRASAPLIQTYIGTLR